MTYLVIEREDNPSEYSLITEDLYNKLTILGCLPIVVDTMDKCCGSRCSEAGCCVFGD